MWAQPPLAIGVDSGEELSVGFGSPGTISPRDSYRAAVIAKPRSSTSCRAVSRVRVKLECTKERKPGMGRPICCGG